MGAKKELDTLGLHARKKWGQNFLTDPNILSSIVDAAGVTQDDCVLEVGPGLGHLTHVLAQRAGRVVAVEVDGDLAEQLCQEFIESPNVRIVQGDVLQFEPIELIRMGMERADASIPFKLVANIPYYITSAILRHVLETPHKPRVVVVMVQREVAQRIIARPPHMNLLAVSVQLFARARVMRVVPAGAFYPRPQVDSAVVRLDVFEKAPINDAETHDFFEIVRAGFGERRKQLRNALVGGLGWTSEQASRILARAQIDPMRRAETLSLEEWSRLYRSSRL
jgi:16S rRNA (adenine1518-N6/adenine1519-N6)-dimethyltransferase